jgi:histidyl-tRNA synthetase
VSERFQAPKGVQEYVPPDSEEFLAVREGLCRPARLAGYGYVELPVFEDEALFARGVGESTDVVTKEMYTFTDRGGRSLSLRPEGTAGVMRAVIEHGLHQGRLPVKVRYAGPFFRAERPQRGRYRQFHQVGVEAIGSDDPMVDAEVVAIGDAAFRTVGLTRFELQLTSLGCAACRPAYREALLGFLAGRDLDEATRVRAELNPLRVLDDKRPDVQAQLAAAPLMVDHLCQECRQHYDEVRAFLRALGVAWTENPRLVRGLDYYTRTTFEFAHPLLGAQSGIGGGGRYDGLMESLGGPQLSGIGFGLGTDRTLLAREAEGLPPLAPPLIQVFGVAIGEAARDPLLVTITQLRDAGVAADLAFGSRGLKGVMKAADRSGARWAVIIGEAEAAAGTVQVKDLLTGEQTEVARGDVSDLLSKHRETKEGGSHAEDS